MWCIVPGLTLEMEIGSQCVESILKDFKTLSKNHGKAIVAGQLTPLKHNRLRVSEAVIIEGPIGGYMEMMDYRNVAKGLQIALDNNFVMKCYLEKIFKD